MFLSSVPPQQGVLHTYGFNLTAFEFTQNYQSSENILLFVGGLGNGLLNVPYLPALSKSTSDFKGKWNLVQVLLSSAYSGWGTSSLDKDVNQLQKCIKYFRSERGGSRNKIVLMGHSTGCQDSIHYLTKILTKPDIDDVYKIDAAILQAPVSDSEAFSNENDVDDLIKQVQEEYIEKGKEDELLPNKFRKLMFNTPVTAYRFISLVGKRGDDDYFSSYLTQDDYKQTFGVITGPILILYGESDQFVPGYVDKAKLINKWEEATPKKYWSKYSSIISGATHDLSDTPENSIPDLIRAVINFINNLD
ncbi:unnamed protein product [Candida verbasci]|uniref:DUF1749-domain-containing protein n=1 Tax=Candida verbasci TaxID=1227364 RepID=A0A9W4TY53_9ASCO|nr:unnamed protein product [Candida verbasci]